MALDARQIKVATCLFSGYDIVREGTQESLAADLSSRITARSNYSLHFVERMGSVTAITGRIIDTTANWPPPTTPLSDDDRKRMRRLAENLATIGDDLLARRVPHLTHLLRRTTL
jgi:hypothetical protein